MTTHSSVHAWRIPRIEGPGGLWSMGLQRIVHDQATNTYIHMRYKNRFFFLILINIHRSENVQTLFALISSFQQNNSVDI